MPFFQKNRFTLIAITFFLAFYGIGYLGVRFLVLQPLKADFNSQNQRIEALKKTQTNQTELLDQIKRYRDGLFALNLLLEARKNVVSGTDEKNPYLIFDFTQVLDDLRQILPRDARVLKLQVNNKGLVTIPIESVDYASLGRVLKSFKNSKLFTEVKIPSGAQRMQKKVDQGTYQYFENIYSFVLQAQLDPEFWKDPMPYSDVNQHEYYSQAIRDLTVAGSIEGYPEGTFRPEAPINRAEFFKVALFEFLAKDAITVKEYKKYTDLSDKDWPYQYAQLAGKMGIVDADHEGRFKPEETITRLEALKTIFTIFKIETKAGKKSEDTAPFVDDVHPDDEIYPLVKQAAQLSLLDHFNGHFNRDLSISRAELTYWIWKIKFDSL